MNTPLLITPSGWEDYELIDSGNGEKLERFGTCVTIRPEPQALWDKSMDDDEWNTMADAVFRRADKQSSSGDERGTWTLKKGVPEQWWISYRYKNMSLRMRMGLTSFKHVGVFPEQAANWQYIYENILKLRANIDRVPRILNLFAYTGGASLAARSARAEVTHVDSVKQVVTWARENMERSGLDGIRWIVDDAMKFVRREQRRGNHYDGIILDPPAYGRGPEGERWLLEQNITELITVGSELLSPGGFIVLNLYSMGLSPLLTRTAVRSGFGVSSREDFRTLHSEEFGELFFNDRFGKSLPLGIFYRATKK